MHTRRQIVLGLVTLVCAATSSQASGDPSTPTLTTTQQARLTKIQSRFVPGMKNNSPSYGFGKLSEFCGANIPMEIHPSMVALEKPKEEDRSDIETWCQAFADSVTYTCGYQPDADPVIKEMVRNSVKKLSCRATSNANDVGSQGVKYALENGTLVFTTIVNNGKLGGGNITEEGDKFLKVNVRRGVDGISIGGQVHKRYIVEHLSPAKNTLVEGLKKECGVDLTVSVDDKLAEHFSKHTGHSAISTCNSAMQVVYTSCRTSSDTVGVSPVIKAAAKKLKGISCVYSETESIAVKPNGILEMGYSLNAQRPKWPGVLIQSTEDYYFEWMKANIGTLGSSTPSAANAPSAAPRPSVPSKAAGRSVRPRQ